MARYVKNPPRVLKEIKFGEPGYIEGANISPPKMDPTAVPDQGIKPPEEPVDVIEQLKAEFPLTARIATESIPRKKRD